MANGQECITSGTRTNKWKENKMEQVLFINANRSGYGVDQIESTMTAGELICYLEQFEEDTKVYLKHDNGYTYGGINWDSFEDEEVEADVDEEQ